MHRKIKKKYNKIQHKRICNKQIISKGDSFNKIKQIQTNLFFCIGSFILSSSGYDSWITKAGTKKCGHNKQKQNCCYSRYGWAYLIGKIFTTIMEKKKSYIKMKSCITLIRKEVYFIKTSL